MLIIPVKDGENIDRALKRFKRKFDRTKTMRQLRDRKQFTKPSVRNRKQMIKAKYVQRKRVDEELS
jgi:small subunit ribosomal protein S21